MIMRSEHPKPQFMRKTWENLNGPWQFQIDHGCSGEAQGWASPEKNFSMEINVPFCPESRLSGIGYTDFMNSVWYKRSFTLTEEQCAGRVVLHFGAVDYDATVWIGGKKVGTHRGGYVSFSFDITAFVVPGENILTVHAADDTRSPLIPCGKQCHEYASMGCHYTRTTGIWQTVWLEFTPQTYIQSAKYTTDVAAGTLTVAAKLRGAGTLRAEASFGGKPMGCAEVTVQGGDAILTVSLAEKHLWEVGQGRLYDLVLSYGEDKVESYFGLRSIRLDGYKFMLNDKSVFQRLVLDQGFYPEGIYTAPSDADLEGDIKLSLAMGFNGARLHEKIFEERFLYHCDKLGYIVWGEYPNWGLDISRPESIYAILPEWLEELERDFNHPAIIGWCPFNETWDTDGRRQIDDVLRTVYLATKAADPTRPCIDTSGNFHVVTDIFDTHDYEQNVAIFKEHYDAFPGKLFDHQGHRQHYTPGQPVFLSEYGGIRWSEDPSGWGYGNAPKTEEEFLTRLKGLTDVLLDNKCMLGYCYTQLTDVEQEQNGLYTYDRRPKFPAEVIHPIFSRKAAIEE